MEELIQLTATARLIKQLGEQLISDEMVAITELIKNSYDADATRVEVIVDTKIETEYGKGKIIIKDNGNGMVPSIIKNSFLKLSTGFKEVEKISPYFKRRVLGKKGIGRLSFQRLGKFIKVYTTPRIKRLKENNLIDNKDMDILSKYNKFYIEMDWYNLNFDLDFKNIKSKLSYKNDEYIEYGTYIEILGINNLDYWIFNNKKEMEMKKNISAMINPFLTNKDSRFLVSVTIDDNKINNDMFDEETLQKTCDCEVSFKFNNWKLYIDITRSSKYFSLLISGRIKKMNKFDLIRNDYEGNENKILEKYKERIIIDFNDMDELKKRYTFLKNIKLDTVTIDGKNTFASPGEFSGKIYAITRGSAVFTLLDSIVEAKTLLSYGVENRNDIFSVWDSAIGIYVFRNDFRILPYGDYDWNNLGDISQRRKNNVFKPHNVSGYIQLDGISSEKLEEQTNRQGIIQDQYGNNFFTIINSVLIEIITSEDSGFIDSFDVDKGTYDESIIKSKNGLLEYKAIEQVEEKKENQFVALKASLQSVKTELNRDNVQKNNYNLGFFDIEESKIKEEKLDKKISQIETIVTELKEEDIKERRKKEQEKFILEQKLEELKDLYPLIAQGIIVETMTHELNKIEKNIKYYSQEGINLLQMNDVNKNLLISNLKYIIDETYFLKEQLHHLEPTYTKNRVKRENIDIKSFLRDLYCKTGPMNRKAKNNNIDIIVEGDSFTVRANKGYLITIFDNLFINSLYWVEFGEIKKYIKFEVNSNGNYVKIADSGPGVNQKVEKNIFEPFITTKPQDEGRGLGLYIIRELLLSMNCGIQLVGNRVDGNLKEFKIDLSGITKGEI